MGYLTDDTINWNHVEFIDSFLDEHVSDEYKRQPLAQDWARISKGIEELGESVAAFIGVTGQNPRKGFTHSTDQVLIELADTAYTAIYAIQHFTKNREVTKDVLASRGQVHADRFYKLQREA